MAEMTWGSLKTSANGDLTQTLKLQQGNNKMRLVSLPYECHVHWETTLDGSNKRIICSGPGCPICNAGHPSQKRFQILAIDRTDGKIKILEGGNAIFNQIKSYAMDEEYGDPTKYDIKINKSGSGRETKYLVTPSPKKSDLTPEEAAAVEEQRPLNEINKCKTLDELLEMNLEILQSLKAQQDEDYGWGSDDEDITSDDDDDWNDI